MTYRQVKANVKSRRTLMLASIGLIAAGLAIFATIMLNFTFTTAMLAMGSIAYVMSMAGGLLIFMSLRYNKEHTKCVKCRRQVDMADFMNMEDFKCPHCGFEADADAETW